MPYDDVDRLRARLETLESAGQEATRMLRIVLQAYDENRMVRSMLTPSEIGKVVRSLEMDCRS
jgi:hypothetical protein